MEGSQPLLKNVVRRVILIMSKENRLPFNKTNYMIMIGGIAVLILGFIVMSIDQEEYGFGFFGLTLGPIIVVIGFIVEFFAILYRPKQDK